MQTKHAGMIETVKDGIVAAIKGTGDIVQATVETVRKAVAKPINGVKVALKETELAMSGN